MITPPGIVQYPADEPGHHQRDLHQRTGTLHQDLIEQQLKGPDGARLMDRPLKYQGGIQTFFQRAESSTFFGREIGLMYIHEHIRYAESLARTGRADAFLIALRQAIPVAYRDVVPCGDIRQSNCYYSSSDVIFKNRYEADERMMKSKPATSPSEADGGFIPAGRALYWTGRFTVAWFADSIWEYYCRPSPAIFFGRLVRINEFYGPCSDI